jgi:hypothetical protein
MNRMEGISDENGSQSNSTERMDYLLECFRASREELLFRVKHRDDWLKLQLLAQASLLALAKGVEIAGLKAGRPYPDLMSFSVTISLIFSCLYYTEDSLIGHLAEYIATLSKAEVELNHGQKLISNWDMSEQLKQYARFTLPSRFFAQIVAFILIPVGLTLFQFIQLTNWNALQWGEAIADTVFCVIIGFLCVRGYLFRRQAGRNPSGTVLISYKNQEELFIPQSISNSKKN